MKAIISFPAWCSICTVINIVRYSWIKLQRLCWDAIFTSKTTSFVCLCKQLVLFNLPPDLLILSQDFYFVVAFLLHRVFFNFAVPFLFCWGFFIFPWLFCLAVVFLFSRSFFFCRGFFTLAWLSYFAVILMGHPRNVHVNRRINKFSSYVFQFNSFMTETLLNRNQQITGLVSIW